MEPPNISKCPVYTLIYLIALSCVKMCDNVLFSLISPDRLMKDILVGNMRHQ